MAVRQANGARPRAASRVLAIAMLTPAILLLAALILGPLGYSGVLSLFDWTIVQINQAKEFVGFANFERLIHDPDVANALRNTIIYVVFAVGVEVTLGFLIALALFHLTKGRRMANALILLPMIVAPVITALLWRYLLDPQFGLMSQTLALFGHQGGIDWFGSDRLALPALIIVDIWQWTPFAVLVIYAGMLSVPQDQLEAARVDGAGHVREARSIILPAVMPQILLVLLFRTMDTYRIFDTVFVLTRGGPGESTETIGLYTYQTGFSFFEMGYAMALSIFILITVLFISVTYIRLLRRRDRFL